MYVDVIQAEGTNHIELEPVLVETKEDTRKWELRGEEGDGKVKIVFHEKAFVLVRIEEIPGDVVSSTHEIESWIKEFLKERFDEAQEGFDNSEDNETEEPKPYDPHKINIRNQNWSISHVFELMDKWNQVDLAPDFQRGFVWDYARRSQLIESLMLRIPVPAFYLSETLDGRYQVVDGLQRLTTIRGFLRNEFPLKHLEYLQEQEGRWFKEDGKKKGIDQMYWRNILQTQITVNIIEDSSPTKVKYDVFRRVNTGGKPLNNQEIRNCLSESSTRALVNELAYSQEFREATGGSIGTGRMQAQELALRFICFWHDKVKHYKEWEYRGNMTEYLDTAIDLLNRNKAAKHEEIKAAFYRAMKNAYYLFGQYCFRKYLPEHFKLGTRQQLINKSLFTTWSVLLSELPEDLVHSNFDYGGFAIFLAGKLDGNKEYYDVVSYKTNDRAFVDIAFANADELINEHFKQ